MFKKKQRWALPPLLQRCFFEITLLVLPTLIEMLGEFFLIYDEGRRYKVIYDEIFFPIYDGKFPWIFP
jgi:hypothetical protein